VEVEVPDRPGEPVTDRPFNHLGDDALLRCGDELRASAARELAQLDDLGRCVELYRQLIAERSSSGSDVSGLEVELDATIARYEAAETAYGEAAGGFEAATVEAALRGLLLTPATRNAVCYQRSGVEPAGAPEEPAAQLGGPEIGL
jgi:hypothetical protein